MVILFRGIAVCFFSAVLSIVGISGSAVLVVPDDFATIQGAIDASDSGDTISVKSGDYREALKFKSGVRLIGEGMDKVRIISDVSVLDESVISFVSCKGAYVEGVTFEQRGAGETLKPAVYINSGDVEMVDCSVRNALFHGIYIGAARSRVTITRCSVSGSGKDGILATPGRGTVVITDCSVTENGRRGMGFQRMCRGVVKSCEIKGNSTGVLFSGDCDVQVENCSIEGNKTGVHVQAGAKVNIIESIISNNAGDAVYLTSDKTDVTISGNRIISNRGYGIISYGVHVVVLENVIEGNKYYGISFLKATRGEISGNKVFGNGKGGAVIYQSSVAEVRDNEFGANQGHGLFMSGDSEGTAGKNKCQGNSGNGIHISSQAAGWNVFENICAENKGNGICVRGEAVCPVLDKNVCRGNMGSGICLCLASAATLKGNRCIENKSYGLKVDVLASAVQEENTYQGNLVGEVYFEEGQVGRIRDLLIAGKFEELEKIVEQLRGEKSKTSEGRSRLSIFYGRLGNGWGTPGHDRFKWFCGVLEKWLEKYPESLTAHNLKLNNINRSAWKARGKGYWKDVPPEGRKAYQAELEKGWTVVENLMALPGQDGEAYAYAIMMAVELGKSSEIVEDFFVRGVSIAPDYHKIYSFRSRYLVERWGGKHGELEAFMDKAYELTKDSEGASIYARIATFQIAQYGVSELATHGIAYVKLRSGFSDVLDRYPDSRRFQNACCLVAVSYKDRELARKMFGKIGDAWMSKLWKSSSRFHAAKKWAYNLKNT